VTQRSYFESNKACYLQVIENESIKGINNFPTLVKFSHADRDTDGDGKANAHLNVDELGMYLEGEGFSDFYSFKRSNLI